MKNKKIQRVLCFCLALLCCFTLTDVFAPMQAKAVTLELGWVTWAIIAYMAACGITFTATGGINALQNAVEEAWDEFQNTQADIVDLSDYITFYTPPSGDGPPDPNETGLQFGYAAAALLAKFVEWLTGEKGWDKGSTVSVNSNLATVDPSLLQIVVDGVTYDVNLCLNADGSVYSRSVGASNPISGKTPGTIVPYPNNIGFVYGTDSTFTYGAEMGYYQTTEDTLKFVCGGTTSNLTTLFSNYGYTLSDYVGIVFVLNQGTSYTTSYRAVNPCFLFSDGNILFFAASAISRKGSSYTGIYELVSETGSIIVPLAPKEFALSENQCLIINFSEIFGDAAPENIEDATNAIAQTVIDTGTLPAPETEVYDLTIEDNVTDSSPTITPMPSPTVTDIEDMGLPQLGEVLMTRFPFSIPRDISRIVSVITADRQPPKWEVDFYSPLADKVAFRGDTKITIDMAEYETVGQICRWTSVIGFCIFLILITKSMIGW